MTFDDALHRVMALATARRHRLTQEPTIASRDGIDHALLNLPHHLPNDGLGLNKTSDMLFDTVLPALAPGQAGPRYTLLFLLHAA